MEAPEHGTDNDDPHCACEGENDVGRDEDGDANGQEHAAAGPVGQAAKGVGTGRVNHVHHDKNGGDVGVGEADALGAQEEEGFAEAGEGQHRRKSDHEPETQTQAAHLTAGAAGMVDDWLGHGFRARERRRR